MGEDNYLNKSDRELLQETHDAVITLTASCALRCKQVDNALVVINTRLDRHHVEIHGNGRDGLKSTVAWHSKLLWIIAVIIGPAVGGIFTYIIQRLP